MSASPTPFAAPTKGARASRSAREMQLPATIVLTALTAVTVIGMIRVFAEWDFVRPMLAVAVGTHAIAALTRFLRLPGWFAVPVILAAAFGLVCLVYYRDTLTGPFPTTETLDLLRLDVRLVWQQFPSAVAPVPGESSFAPVTALAVALLATMSDVFAFRAFGRVEAVVPAGVLFVFTAALGIDRDRVLLASLWVATALLTIALVRFDSGREQSAWMGSRRFTIAAALPVMLATVVVTGVAAAAIAPRLPGAGETALLDTRNREGSVTEVLSPLVDIRAQLVRRGNVELFEVDSPTRQYWRMVSLPDFDGNTWGPIDEDLDPMGDRSGELLVGGIVVEQVVTIRRLGGHFVPSAYHPINVSPAQVFWASESQTLVLPDEDLERDDVIAIRSIVPELSAAQLRNATVDGRAGSIYLELPGGVPDVARAQAVAVTAGATTPYDRALALQNWFQSEFEYDLKVQLGNSNDAMESFLRDRRGFCQQFAGTYAAMARSLGLPARVAVGFTPGDLGSDGAYHVYGRHAHAWPEVWFDGIGWVAFEPTPSRGAPGALDYTGLPERQDDGGSTPGGTQESSVTTAPQRTIPDPDYTSVPRGDGRPTGTTLPGVAGGSSSGGGDSPVPLVLGALALLAALWATFMPRVVAAIGARRATTAADRVITAWQQVCASLRLAGAPPVGGATPLEFATTAELAVGVDHHALREVAVQVTRAVYSRAGVDESTARRCELLSSEIDARCAERMSISTRIASRFDPRLARRRLYG